MSAEPRPKDWWKSEVVLTPRESAAVLRCSPSSVYELLRQGRLKCVRIGRKTLITPSAIAKFLEGDDGR